MQTIKEALTSASLLFKKSKIDSPILDAEVLLAHLLRKDRVFLLAHSEKKLTSVQEKTFKALAKKRANHTPIAYLVGRKEFYNLTFKTTPSALIPRPETEELVEMVLNYCRKNPEVSSIIDVGTGSGAIAISLASNIFSKVKVFASDQSQKALTLARHNAKINKVNKKRLFKKANLLKGISDKFDIIIANLPYLSQKEYDRGIKLCPELKKEPKSALLAKDHGLALIELLLKQSPTNIKSNGVIFLEIGYEQGKKVEKIAKQYLLDASVEIVKDLCGRDRFIVIYT